MQQDQPFDIQSIHQAYRQGITPSEVIAEFKRRLAEANDPGIFISLLSDEQLTAQIETLGDFDVSKKPLWGTLFAAKDNINAVECQTTAACPDYAYQPDIDAFAIQLLKKAGAILVGKTNLDQFATGLVGVRTPYPVPRNAIDETLVPGGSSSGSATAVARGLVSFSLGTDTAGSGRVPAALNGIVGLKPTLGSISLSGVVPACYTLDTLSVFALTVADANTVFQVVRQYDESDPLSRNLETSARRSVVTWF